MVSILCSPNERASWDGTSLNRYTVHLSIAENILTEVSKEGFLGSLSVGESRVHEVVAAV